MQVDSQFFYSQAWCKLLIELEVCKYQVASSLVFTDFSLMQLGEASRLDASWWQTPVHQAGINHNLQQVCGVSGGVKRCCNRSKIAPPPSSSCNSLIQKWRDQFVPPQPQHQLLVQGNCRIGKILAAKHIGLPLKEKNQGRNYMVSQQKRKRNSTACHASHVEFNDLIFAQQERTKLVNFK